MKIVCIDNSDNQNKLTINKIYETLPLNFTFNESDFYRVIDDKNHRFCFFKEHFMTLKEYRKLKLQSLENNNFNSFLKKIKK